MEEEVFLDSPDSFIEEVALVLLALDAVPDDVSDLVDPANELEHVG